MFSISKYYELIKRLERNKTAVYAIYAIIGFFLGGAIGTAIKNALIGIGGGVILGLFTAHQQTLGLDIKIQKMYWEIDVYKKLNKE